MLVRLGYVAMSVKLPDCSPSKTITVKNLESLPKGEVRISRLRRIAAENLNNTLRLLYHNLSYDIRVFRFTSKLVPLATHPIADGWDYAADLKEELVKIGTLVRKHHLRVSTHPDHFTLLNSPRPEVMAASRRDLDYHHRILEAMDLPEAEMIMHVGGLYGSREQSLERFKRNWLALPEAIKKRLRLENDDKVYGAAEVLALCRELGMPMVLDVHHHACLNRGEHLADLLPGIIDTWGGRVPKFHFSSPKSSQNCRAHADDIELSSFCDFLQVLKRFGWDADVMLEAKNKDAALFNLVVRLQTTPGITMVDGASIEI